MPCCREELEKREYSILAEYAQKSADSRGRVHLESPPEWRTNFQRDHDRVIHSRAFRRLEYKTQVFLNGSGDHLRTRLTHTIEVAAIARNIALALRLNEDLAETIALAHDIGHPPFGHRGEDCLSCLMKEEGGFEHNLQSLRIVEYLEKKYPLFPGLNLSWEVREGLAKHHTSYDNPSGVSEFNTLSSSLEAQVADIADEIAYQSHDLDDGLDMGLLNEAELEECVAIWKETSKKVSARYGALSGKTRCYFITRCIIDNQVKDVVNTAEKMISESGVRSVEEVRRLRYPLVQYSSENREMNMELRKYLRDNLYMLPTVDEPTTRAIVLLEDLFRYKVKHPEEFPQITREAIEERGLKRAVCDSLVEMTDRSVLEECERIFNCSFSI